MLTHTHTQVTGGRIAHAAECVGLAVRPTGQSAESASASELLPLTTGTGNEGRQRLGEETIGGFGAAALPDKVQSDATIHGGGGGSGGASASRRWTASGGRKENGQHW